METVQAVESLDKDNLDHDEVMEYAEYEDSNPSEHGYDTELSINMIETTFTSKLHNSIASSRS